MLNKSSQGSVATRCGCGEKYNASFVANLLLSPTVNKFRKSVNINVKVMNI